MSKCICRIGDYDIKDRTAREQIKALETKVNNLPTGGSGGNSDSSTGGTEPEAINLLPGAIDLTCDNTSNPTFYVNEFSIGLEADNQYNVKATVDGEEFTVLCGTEAFEGMVALVGIETEMPTLGNVTLICYDNCDLSAEQQPILDITKSVLALMSTDNNSHTATLNAIEKVKLESYNNLTNKPMLNNVILEGSKYLNVPYLQETIKSYTAHYSFTTTRDGKPERSYIHLTYVGTKDISTIEGLLDMLTNKGSYYPCSGWRSTYTDSSYLTSENSVAVVGISKSTLNENEFRVHCIPTAETTGAPAYRYSTTEGELVSYDFEIVVDSTATIMAEVH